MERCGGSSTYGGAVLWRSNGIGTAAQYVWGGAVLWSSSGIGTAAQYVRRGNIVEQ